MKKLLILLFVIVLAFALFSCGNTEGTNNTGDSSTQSSTDGSANNNAPHTHAYGEWIIVVEPKCDVEGVRRQTCSCGAFVEETAGYIAHTLVDVKGYGPTCEAPGLTDGIKCSVCGMFTENQIAIEILPHTEIILEAKDSTCTENGLTEGKQCSVCETIYVVQQPLPLLPHNEVEVPEVLPTCTETGLSNWFKCDDCGYVIQEPIVLQPSHSPKIIEGKAPTCYETGLTPGSECSVCGFLLQEQEVLPIEHSRSVLKRVEPDCYNVGWTEGEWCDLCFTVLIPQEEIPRKHIPVVSEGYAAGCFANGLKDGIVCDNCGFIIQEQEIIPAAHVGKVLPGVIATCTNEGLTDGLGCENCDTILIEQKVIPYTLHSFVDGLCSHCSITSFSQELNYVLSEDGTYYIVKGIGTCKDKKVVIPETYKNKPVKEIATSAFASVNSFYSIVIPSSIERIGSDAFNYANRLIEVYNLSQHINIQIGVEDDSKLGAFAKFEYNSLDTPSVIEAVGDFDFVTLNGVNYLLGYNGNDVKLTLPENYNGENYKIYNYAFAGHKQLISIVVPRAVYGTGPYSFSSCTSLVEVYNLSGLQLEYNGVWQYGDLGKYAMAIHTSLDTPSIVDIVGDFAFVSRNDINFLVAYLGNETNVTFPSDYRGNRYSINQRALQGAKFEHVTLPGTINNIGPHAFEDCINLKSITIGEGIGFIDDYAFAYSGLRQVVIPDSVTLLGVGVFGACESLGIVYIGDGVTAIPGNAFGNCPNLASVRLPKNLISINSTAFSNSEKIREIINHSNLNIKANSTDNGGIASMYYALIYKGETARQSAFIVDDFTFIVIDGAYHLASYLGKDEVVTLPSSVNGSTYTVGYMSFADRRFMYEVIIPDGVIALDGSAFESCIHLEKVTIAGSVKIIGNSAFRWCSKLTDVTLEEGVESLGKYAFYQCSSLTSIVLPESLNAILTKCFYGSSNLTSVEFTNPNGWYTTSKEGASSGYNTTVPSDATKSAAYLKDDSSYWYRKTK